MTQIPLSATLIDGMNRHLVDNPAMDSITWTVVPLDFLAGEVTRTWWSLQVRWNHYVNAVLSGSVTAPVELDAQHPAGLEHVRYALSVGSSAVNPFDSVHHGVTSDVVRDVEVFFREFRDAYAVYTLSAQNREMVRSNIDNVIGTTRQWQRKNPDITVERTEAANITFVTITNPETGVLTYRASETEDCFVFQPVHGVIVRNAVTGSTYRNLHMQSIGNVPAVIAFHGE